MSPLRDTSEYSTPIPMHTLLTSAGARGQRPTQRKTDSNDCPRPKPAAVLRERFMAAPHEEGCCKKKNNNHTFCCFQRTINAEARRRGGKGHRVFKEIRPGIGFKTTSDFPQINLGGGYLRNDSEVGWHIAQTHIIYCDAMSQ